MRKWGLSCGIEAGAAVPPDGIHRGFVIVVLGDSWGDRVVACLGVVDGHVPLTYAWCAGQLDG